jgi:aerobic-type carbon monoxide dehydrogenase small subunit (CoxS/CutS family)
MHIELTVNGTALARDVPVQETLMTFLRREGYWSVKHGCETGECGACAVLLDNRPVNSCLILAVQAQGRIVTTLEALGTPEKLHPLQKAFVEHGAIQCGYCTPAMILVAKALLDENPHPSEEEVRDALAGTLCRCTGYVKPIAAVLSVAENMCQQ